MQYWMEQQQQQLLSDICAVKSVVKRIGVLRQRGKDCAKKRDSTNEY